MQVKWGSDDRLLLHSVYCGHFVLNLFGVSWAMLKSSGVFGMNKMLGFIDIELSHPLHFGSL